MLSFLQGVAFAKAPLSVTAMFEVEVIISFSSYAALAKLVVQQQLLVMINNEKKTTSKAAEERVTYSV